MLRRVLFIFFSASSSCPLIVRLRLLLPDPVSRNVSVGGTHLKTVEQKLILRNVNKEDQGSYACLVMDHSDNHKVRI